MSKQYLFLSIFLTLFAVTANAACQWQVGQIAKISTIQDLQSIQECIPAHGMVFELVNDIDASGFPFQTLDSGFDGTLDGKNPINGANFKILNLQPVTDGGLIDAITGAGVVKNLTLENVNVHGGSDPTYSYGGLVNVMMGETAQISNVSVSGKVTGNTPSSLGGIVGRLIMGKIAYTSSNVTLTPGINAKYNGALVGWQQGGEINSCLSSGTIVLRGNTEGNGGIVGLQSNDGFSESPVITRSLSTTVIDLSAAKTGFGNGVLAGAVGTGGGINNSYANGTIKKASSNAMFISGGAVGYLMDEGKLDKIYSSSKFFPKGDPDADGGLVGLTPFAHNDISCTNSYWDSEFSGLDSSAACSDGGRSTEDMQGEPTEDTFLGWSRDIWGFGKGYPNLLLP